MTSVSSNDSTRARVGRMAGALFALTVVPMGVALAVLAVPTTTGAAFSGLRGGSLGAMIGMGQAMILGQVYGVMWAGMGARRACVAAVAVLGYGLGFGGAVAGAVYVLGYVVLAKFHMAVLFAAVVAVQGLALVADLIRLRVKQSGPGPRVGPSVGRVIGLYVGLAALFGQLGVAMLFKKAYFSVGSEIGKVAMCAGYPLVIFALKVVQQSGILCPELNGHIVEPIIEFGSLALAALPYRVIFITLSNWTTFAMVLIVELVFKALVYPVQFSSVYHALCDKARALCCCTDSRSESDSGAASLRRAPSRKSTSTVALATMPSFLSSQLSSSSWSGGDDISAHEQEEEEVHVPMEHQQQLAAKFFFHTFVDSVSIIGVAIVLGYFRMHRETSMVSTDEMSNARFTKLLIQFGIGLVIELVFVVGFMLATRLYFQALHFQPIHSARGPLLDHTLALAIIYMVAYLGVFFLIDSENLPKH